MRSILQLRRQKVMLLVSLAMVVWVQPEAVWATSKPHVITFGKWTTVQWMPGIPADAKDRNSDDKDKEELAVAAPSRALPLALKVRPLLVDARVKEFTLGQAHEVTDRLFVVRR